MTIALDALGQTYMTIAAQTGLSPALMHRVAVIGSGTLDILPHNGAVVTLLAVCGSTHRESYFDMYPGVWRHGDWMRITPRGGVVIYGRSDATINRHGIRMGTSELYRAVEEFPEIVDSLVVDLEYLGRASYMPLFVVLRPECALTEELKGRINSRIREALSARHVPNEIVQVPEVPRTISGKKMELPVKKLLLGIPVEKVANRDAMSNPQSLSFFMDFAARLNARTE